MRAGIAIASVCAIGFATGGGFIAFQNRLPAEPLAVSPPIASAIKPLIEGSQPAFHFVLENRSPRPINVIRMSRSCGCMSVSFSEGRELPLVISPHESIPFEVVVSTDGRLGKSEHTVVFSAAIDGSPIDDLKSTIAFSVLSKLRPIPSSIVWTEAKPGTQQSAEIILADEFEAPPAAPPEIVLSSSNGMSVECQKVDGQMEMYGTQANRRFRLNVKMIAPTDVTCRSETILVRTESPDRREIQIPVTCHVQQDVSCHPAIVSIVGGVPRKAVDATVLCVTSRDIKANPEITSLPRDMKIETRRLGPRVLQLLLHFHLPDHPGIQRIGSVTVRFPDLKATASIPVVLKLDAG